MVPPKTVQHHSNTARQLLLCCVETSPHFSGQSITESVQIKTPLKTPYSPIYQSCSLTLLHIYYYYYILFIVSFGSNDIPADDVLTVTAVNIPQHS